jgi:hypothetical protein
MIGFILTNWKALLASLATAIAAYGLHFVDVTLIENRHRAELAAQIESDKSQCLKNQIITAETSNEYETALDKLNRDYDVIRLRQHDCAMPASDTTSGHHAIAARGVHVSKNAEPLEGQIIGYARDAEKYRLQLKACQSFIKKTWKANSK